MTITLNIHSLSAKILNNLLFGMGFAQHYNIGINWDHTGALYLWYKGRKLMSAWHSSAMPQCVIGITNHITNVDTTSNRLGTRLVTTKTVTITPYHIAIIPVTPPSHSLCSNNIPSRIIEVIKIHYCIFSSHTCVL